MKKFISFCLAVILLLGVFEPSNSYALATGIEEESVSEEQTAQELIEEQKETPDMAQEIREDSVSEETVQEVQDVPAEEPEEVETLEEAENPEGTETSEGTGTSEEAETPEGTEASEETEAPAGEETPEETQVPGTEEVPETEQQFATDFTYEDAGILVTAKAEEAAGLPVGTEFKAEALAKDSDEYKAAVAAVEAGLNLGENQQLLFVPYDIYFMHEGERIEPEAGTVHVEMAFSNAIFDTAEGVTLEEPFVAHIKNDGEVEQLENQAGNNRAVVFDIASFSVMGPAAIATKEAGTYTLTFDTNGGTMSESSVVTKTAGEAVGALPVPTREGYTFSGWICETLKPAGLKLTFNSQSRTESTTYDYLYFYYKDSDGNLRQSGKYGGSNLAGQSVSIPASEFWIYFHSDGSSTYYGFAFDAIEPLDTAPSGFASTAASLPSYSVIETSEDVYPESAHDYANNTNQLWHYIGGAITEATVMPEENLVCKAFWTPNKYEITFDSNGGSVVDPYIRTVGEKIGELPVPTREGYHFDGWFTEVDGGEKITPNHICAAEAVTYYAHWGEGQPYAILYENGELAFQYGDAADENKGAVIAKYTGFESSRYSSYRAVPWYKDKASIKSVTMKDAIHPVSTAYCFYNLSALVSADLSMLDTSNATSMYRMFSGCSSLPTLDVRGWDTSNVTSMSYMFSSCSSLPTLDVSGWDTTNVTDMDQMFSGCRSLTTLDVRGWNTSNVADMVGLFGDCSSLPALDISDWNTSNVTDMSSMFVGCSSLSELDVSNWNMSNVTNMYRMFFGCNSLETLDVTSWDTTNVTSMGYMFNGCSSLTSLDVRGWDTTNVTDMSNMFYECGSLTTLDVAGWDTSNVRYMDQMFKSCSSLMTLDVAGWDTSNVTSKSEMFFNCSSLRTLDVRGWDTSNVTNMNYMFYDCGSLTTLDVRDWNTSKVTNMGGVFTSCSNLTTLDVSGWDTTNVTNMEYMFYECGSLTTLDVSGWDTSKVMSMEDMFYGCSRLTMLDVRGWNTSNVKNMRGLFAGCGSLMTLDLGEKFKFVGSPSLPGSKWVRLSTGEIYAASGLVSQYDGTTMADRYVRTRIITFDATGGSVSPNTIEAYIGMSVDAVTLPVPTKKCAYFDGWYTERNGGEKLEPGGTIMQTTYYYAHWTDYTYQLILKPNGPEADNVVVNLGYRETYALPGRIFVRDGYVLSGWNTRPNGTGVAYKPMEYVFKLTDEDQESVILYAQWTQISEYAAITFDTQGFGEIPPIRVRTGTTVARKELPDAMREDYTFMGWHQGSVDGAKLSSDLTVTEDVVLYAEWKKDPVVTFENGVSSNPIQRKVKYNTAIGTLPTFRPNANNYQTLIGWFTELSGGTQITDTTKVTEDVTYYAHWGWTPKFNANGGKLTGSEEYPLQESSSYKIEKLPEAVRDGYRLTGWYLADGVTSVQDGDTVNLENGIEIVAHWERKDTVKVTFESDGELIKTIELYKDTALTGLPVPTKSGYVFLGWADEEGHEYAESSIVTSDLYLKAQWDELTYTVTFNPGSGTMNNSSKTKKVTAGGTIQTLPGARLEGQILEGWYTEAYGQGEKLTTETVINADVTYHARYIPVLSNNNVEGYEYVFGAEWINASSVNVDNIADNLEFHPTTNTTQTSSLHVRFELNKSVGDAVLPVGSVKIRIPKYIWKNWDGNWTGTNDLSRYVPKHPDVTGNMFFSYIEDGDNYVLINNRELSGGSGLDLVISYQVTPINVPGGAIDSNGAYVDGYNFYKGTVPVIATVDSNLDDVPETREEKDLTVEMHTGLDTSVSKTYWDVSYVWNTSWGAKPADAEDYFYVTWRIFSGDSSVTQPASMVVSEDTVHDGTVVYWYDHGPVVHNVTVNYSYSDYVVMKYPMELLADIPETGLVLKNETVLKTTWKSGYVTYDRASASTTIYDAEYPEGEFDKNNRNSGSVCTINGGQEDILDDQEEVTMNWRLEYDGASHNTPVTWNEETQTYHADTRTIVMTDGVPGDLMYSSGQASAKYVWEPVTGNVTLSDEDYHVSALSFSLTEYDCRQVGGVWMGTNVHTNKDDYDGIDVYVRYRNTDEFVYYKTVHISNTSYLDLPEDVAGYQIRHNTDYYSTDLIVNCTVKLEPTQHVQALIQNDVNKGTTSLIKNKAVCDIWNTDDETQTSFFHMTNEQSGNNPANKVIYELNVSTTSQYTVKYTSDKGNVLFDAARGTQDNPVYIAGWNYNTSSRKKQIKTGEFYDLLPEGTTVDAGTVFGIPLTGNSSSMSNYANSYESYKNSSSKLDKALYDIRFVPDWEGSGRTMMIIRFAVPENIKATGMQFWYLLHNTYENVVENGTTVENDVAFVNTTEGAVLPYSKSGSQNTISSEYRKYYDSLQTRYSDFISYAKASTNYNPVNAYSWGFTKSVKTNAEYEHSGMTIPNNEYTYRLTYSQSDNADSSGIVFYDILEKGVERKNAEDQIEFLSSEWHGVLKSVDVSRAAEKPSDGKTDVYCSPVIYYSTKDRASFTGEDYNVANTATWSKERPSDASTITAVAVDCSKATDGSDFIMKGRNTLDIYLTMVSPVDAEFYGKTAYNEGVAYAKTGDTGIPTPKYSDADVTLKNVEPELHKTSNPETGTQDAPTIVHQDGELIYTISVKNTDDTFTLNDIVVEDTIPDGLLIDTANIKVHFGDVSNAVKVSVSPRVSLEKTGQHLTFKISSLLPGETMNLVIPTLVTAEKGVLENTAKITSINNVAKELKSETTWHEIRPEAVAVSISKTVAGSMGNKTKDFHFELKLSGGSIPESLAYTKGDETGTVTVTTGVAEFTLAHGETIIFPEVPSGLTYEVIETDGESDGYTVESVDASGTLGEADVTVAFTNRKSGTIPTLAAMNTRIFVPVMLLAVAGMVWFFCRRFRLKRKKKNA